ncbi:MAG: DUF4834 family protein [Hyphomicrobiales bacterium]
MTFLIGLIIFIFAIRFLFKYLVPYLIRRKFEKMMGGNPFAQEDINQETNQSASYKKEGETHVDYVPPKKKRKFNSQNAGDYVEFEDMGNN